MTATPKAEELLKTIDSQGDVRQNSGTVVRSKTKMKSGGPGTDSADNP